MLLLHRGDTPDARTDHQRGAVPFHPGVPRLSPLPQAGVGSEGYNVEEKGKQAVHSTRAAVITLLPFLPPPRRGGRGCLPFPGKTRKG